MPQCEVCGRDSRFTQEIKLEGALLRVCSRCAKLGEPVRTPSAPRTSTAAHSSPRTSKGRPTPKRSRERELVPVEDFARQIRIAREKRGMSQQDVARELNERSSIIAKLESGKISPTIRIARKLERLFKLTLLEEAESLDLPYQPPKSTATLGDVVQIRRKKDSS